MKSRPNEPPMGDPLAFFITWVTYGTWLPGDERGWVEYHRGWQLPDPVRELEAKMRMTEDACRLDHAQRRAVEEQVTETCRIRGWDLHALNCRSNHLHVVLTASAKPKIVRAQLKAWCTRKLKTLEETRLGKLTQRDAGKPLRQNWWAERGSQRYIYDEKSLEAAILYVLDGQDQKKNG